MIIRELYLKSFGKFSETKIELEEGFHIFYGENEFGKSTLHAFIRSMLFGLTKGRGRAAKNDLFTKYEPWDQPSYYAGEMTFESGDRTFIISRRFDRYGKSASLVCQTDGEILSVEQGDMDMLLDGMSEAAFENTISIGQTKAETSADLSAELRNYAANYYCSGNSEMDVERALAILKERRKTVENRQKEIRKKKQEKREKVEQQAAYISEEIERKQAEEETYKQKHRTGKAGRKKNCQNSRRRAKHGKTECMGCGQNKVIASCISGSRCGYFLAISGDFEMECAVRSDNSGNSIPVEIDGSISTGGGKSTARDRGVPGSRKTRNFTRT